MSLPSTTDVLIVGGGPTGLVLALALHKSGCSDVVVVDGALLGESTSRAVVLHAATLEALETVGCAEPLIHEGRRVTSTTMWTGEPGDAPIETASFPLLSKYTKYPFILAIPQHVTEKVINNVAHESGIKIFRPHKVINMRPNQEDRHLTDVIFEDGQVIRARCVVGADGARSTIRNLANVGWADPTGEVDVKQEPNSLSNMVLADVTLSSPPSGFRADAINLVITNENAFLFISLPGQPYPDVTTEPVYRVACGIPLELGTPPSAPDTAYVQNLVDLWGPNVMLSADLPPVQITRTVWSSRFRTYSSIADTFFTHVPDETSQGPSGPVLLIGDAAHIHPPMGGQGMNLGIRDGVKLAPVLAEYVRTASSAAAGVVSEAPLQQFAAERRQKALTVIAMVKGLQKALWIPNKRMYFLGFIPYNPGWMRNTMLRFMSSFERFRANGAWNVSGLGNP